MEVMVHSRLKKYAKIEGKSGLLHIIETPDISFRDKYILQVIKSLLFVVFRHVLKLKLITMFHIH